MRRDLFFCAGCIVLSATSLLWLSAPAAAATTELRIFFDLDNDPATGCDVVSPPLLGVEQILLTTVETAPPLASVTGITRQECVDPASGTFGPPMVVDPALLGASLPYPVGVGNGLDGTHVVETFLPLGLLPPGATVVRLGVLATDEAGASDQLITTAPGGIDPILLPLGQAVNVIPTLSTWGLLLLGLLLAAGALTLLRRRSAAAAALALVLLGTAGAAWAVCVLDGEVDDWVGVPPLADDGLADGPAGADLRALFGKEDSGVLCLRVDLGLVLNQPPTADPQALMTDEDLAVVITLTGSDPDGDPLSFAIATGPASGSLGAITPIDATSAQATYTPNPGFSGADSFTFTVNDGTVDSAPATVDITVKATNDPPVADPQMVATGEDTPLVITLTGSDPNGDPLTFAVATGPASGSLGAITPLTPTSAQVTYTPNPNFNGADSFTFTVNDGTVDSAPATVDVTVNAANDPPVANAQMVVTDEDLAVVITLTGSDPEGDPLTFAVATGPANGGLSAITPLNPTSAQVTYTPSLNFNGADSFTFTVNDGTVDSAAATVDITVNPINDPPTALDDSYTTVGNTELTGGGATPTSLARVVDATNPLGNDSDPVEGTALTVVAAAGDLTGPPFVGTSTLGGDVTMNADGSFVYVPPVGVKNRLGGSADTFSYTIEDAGGAQATATVAIEIVDEIVWYLHNDPTGEVLNPAGGDGRSNDPFDKLSDADAVADDPEDASAPGDTIFVFRGDGTTANQSLGITLTSGQKLLGHRAATLLRGGVMIQTPGNGAHPKIEHTAGDGVAVLANAGNGDRSGVEIRGLDITGDDNAVDVAAADAASLDVALTDNLLTSTNGASLVVDGSGSTGTAVVRELAATNVLTAGAGGGQIFESVTFDADVTAAGIQPVAAGNVDVGDPASPGDVTGHGVRLNNVRGTLDFGTLNIGNSGGVGLFVRDADGKAGTFVLDTDGGTISTVNGPAIDLDPVGLGLGGMDGMVLTSVTVNVTAGAVPHGILLHTVAGSFQVTGATSISAGGSGTLTTGIAAVDATAAITFTGTTTVSTTTGAGIALTNIDGPFTVASTTSSVTGAAGAAIDIDQGLGDFTYNGSITNTAGRSLEITNHEGPGGGSTVSLTGSITDSGSGIFLDNNDLGAGGSVVNLTGSLNLTTGGSNAFTASNGGVINVTDPVNNNLAATTTGTAVTITNTTIGASGVKFTTVNVNGAADGILLTNVPSGNFTATGGAVQNVTSRGLDVQGGSGNVTVGASLSTTATGRSLEVTGKMGGTVAVSGAIDDNGLGVNLASNAGSTVTLTGSMDIDTVGANTGFNATGGGIVNVLTGTNDVDTSAGTGIAVNIVGTTIGASDVTFRSVSADGATSGIVLDTTGTSGGLVVTGDGSLLNNASGGTIRNTTSHGIVATDTQDLSLTSLRIENPGDAASEHGILATGLRGTNLLRSSTITGFNQASGDGFRLINNNVNLPDLVIDGSTFSTSDGNDGLSVFAQGNSVMTVRVINNSLFTDLEGDGVDVLAGDLAGSTGTVNLTVEASSFTNAGATGNNGIQARALNGGTLNAILSGNIFNDTHRLASTAGVIEIQGNNTGTVVATVLGNDLDTFNQSGINVVADDSSDVTAVVDGNFIDTNQNDRIGIRGSLRSNGAVRVTIQNNQIGQTTPLPGTAGTRSGIDIEVFDEAGGAVTNNVRVLIDNNQVTVNKTSGTSEVLDFFIDQGATAHLTVTGNTFDNDNAGDTAEIITDTAGTTLCLDLDNNTAVGAGDFELVELGGTYQIESLADVTTRNTGTFVFDPNLAAFDNSAGCLTP